MYMTKERNRFFAEALFDHVRNTTTDQANGLVEYDLSIFSDPDIAKAEQEKNLPAPADDGAAQLADRRTGQLRHGAA